ncbi:hypothetical protein [Pseudonocardia sp.]|uniref:hypothetical protein n=1 Tax=Pseudonocardia sp. TaxID=60912 RepID=UPI003D0B0439
MTRQVAIGYVIATVGLVLALADGLLAPVSAFWSAHSMLTNVVASGIFTIVTVTVIEGWLRNQERHRRAAEAEQERRRLRIVRSVAYNAVARGPIAQRRIMWFLLHGGELRPVPEFRVSDGYAAELRAILARLDLPETSEHDVMDHVADRPCSTARFDVLALDRHWRSLVHDVLLDVVHSFRVLVARWSPLLLTTEEGRHTLTDLAAQVEELSAVFVTLGGRRPVSGSAAGRLDAHRDLWRRAFANAVAMEEKLIDLGGERHTDGRRFTTPGRALLPPTDLARITGRDAQEAPLLTWRLYDGRDSSPSLAVP